MNKIIYNLNTYQLIEIDFSQILVVGQENAINIDLYFKNGDVFKVDTDWQVWLTFERPDGESTNITLATLNNDHYSKKIGSWFTAVAGIGKIFTIIKVNGETIAPFAVAKVQIFEGGTPSDDTISQEQYNELLSNINDVNNKLENHINDKNNPHEVTPEQLNVYEKEHVNDIAEQVDENKTDISTLKTDMGAINGLRTDVNKNTNDISNLGGRVSTNENNIASLGGRLLTAEQEILLRAKITEVVAKIMEHNNDIEAHQYILRLIAAVSAGGVKPLVFDTEAELVEWLESGTIVHQGYTPDMLELGQLLYTIPEDELDYWVSVLPVNELSDLTPLQGMVDLSAYALLTDLEAYAKLTDLDAIMFSLDGVLSSVGILETIKVDKVEGKGLSTNDFTNVLKDKLDGLDTQTELDNKFDDKADKIELSQVYGGKNIGPDLTGKEYLGNGVYDFTTLGQVETYNVYNGLIYRDNQGQRFYSLNFPDLIGTYTIRMFDFQIEGLITQPTFILRQKDYGSYISEGSGTNLNQTLNLTNGLSLTFQAGDFESMSFKIQIEKGSTATPYTLPMVITPEYIRQTQTPRLIYSNSGTSSGTDITFSYVDNTMKVGDIYKVHSQLTYDNSELTQREVNDLIISDTVNNNIEKNHYDKTQHSAITKINYDYTTKTITMIGDFNTGDSSNSFNIRLYKVGY